MTSPIWVYQQNWALVKAEDKTTTIQTGSFGPCFVVTFIAPKIAAMTHIDSKTITSSIQQIFDEFKQLKVDPDEVKVIVLGGWITSRVCNQMADDYFEF